MQTVSYFLAMISFSLAGGAVAGGLYLRNLVLLGIGVFFATWGYRSVALARVMRQSLPPDSEDSRFRPVFRRTAHGFALAGLLSAASTAVDGEPSGVFAGLIFLVLSAVSWFSQHADGEWPARWFP